MSKSGTKRMMAKGAFGAMMLSLVVFLVGGMLAVTGTDIQMPFSAYIDNGGTATQSTWTYTQNGNDPYWSFAAEGQVEGAEMPLTLDFYMSVTGSPKVAAYTTVQSCPYHWSGTTLACHFFHPVEISAGLPNVDYSCLTAKVNDVAHEIVSVTPTDRQLGFTFNPPIADNDAIAISGDIYLAGTAHCGGNGGGNGGDGSGGNGGGNTTYVDTDNDLIVDIADNCPTVPNFDQSDIDGDGIGNQCDPDYTGFVMAGLGAVMTLVSGLAFIALKK
jgi:hypothetical protein